MRECRSRPSTQGRWASSAAAAPFAWPHERSAIAAPHRSLVRRKSQGRRRLRPRVSSRRHGLLSACRYLFGIRHVNRARISLPGRSHRISMIDEMSLRGRYRGYSHHSKWNSPSPSLVTVNSVDTALASRVPSPAIATITSSPASGRPVSESRSRAIKQRAISLGASVGTSTGISTFATLLSPPCLFALTERASCCGL